MSHLNDELSQHIYAACAARRADAIAACCAPGAGLTQWNCLACNGTRAALRFKGGLIAEHHDEFDFHRWARKALDPPGLLFGWIPLIRGAVRRKVAAWLAAYGAR